MKSIYNFHQASDLLACSGQPTEDQLQSAADQGYQVVVNLGLADGKYALADEAVSVKNLGLAYHHLPTRFESPQVDELAEFIGVMNNHADEKTFVHCAANYRASVFTGLYLFAVNELTETAMQDFIEDVWQPDGVWQQFIEKGMEYIKENNL
jgi:protein tyrosine phosphatase (PTP) superfamily phosphohydrolase (DUF442 family)